MDKPIMKFVGSYGFLSNFTPCGVEFDGIKFLTVESAFQAAKTFDLRKRCEISEMDPGYAKKAGNELELREDWEDVKYDIMYGLLRQKYSLPHLREELLATGDAELIEGNHWGDKCWGKVLENGVLVGENNLGKLLMKLRDEIKNKK